MQSLIYESLKFLNDDNDIAPEILFRTNPPSEVNKACVQSHIEADEDYMWGDKTLNSYFES